jgi:hypothetical protein
LNINSKLSGFPLEYKLAGLASIALLLFLPNLLFYYISLKFYYGFYAFFIAMLAGFGFVVIGKKSFIAMLKLWAIGVVIYLLFAIPRIYLSVSLSPYFNFTSLTDRWLYSLLLPLILLGTFTASLIFIQIISPTEFLKWGRHGLEITLLMRALQHSAQVFNETKIALMLQNQWPDGGSSVFNLRASWLIIKSSPLLVSTALRNIILYWFPWGWLCFKKNIGFFLKNRAQLK